MLYRAIALCLLASFVGTPLMAQSLRVTDDFSQAKRPDRSALRGDWKFENGTASCQSDPELYKKFANHGPILRWPCQCKQGKVSFEFKPQRCDRVVVTFNDKGHVVRAILGPKEQSRVLGWIGESSKENKPKVVAKQGLPSLESLDDQWHRFSLIFEDDKAKLEIGESKLTLEHKSFTRNKGEFTISFASGSLAVRDLQIDGQK